MRMRVALLAILFSLSCLCVAGQDPPPPGIVKGRIVLYDWFLHEVTIEDDVVVKLVWDDKKKESKPTYVRVRCCRYFNPEAPPNPKHRMDRLAFLGRGSLWGFSLEVPLHPDDKGACTAPRQKFIDVEDEMGKTSIPRFIPTLGADITDVPTIETLPCYILSPGGLWRIKKPAKANKP